MKNKYEIRGEVTAIFLKSKKYGDMETLISTSKLEKAKQFTGSWYPNYSDRVDSFYAKGNMPKVNGHYGGSVKLHRWVTSDIEGLDVDHFDHDTLNNVDSNLRRANKSENNQNRKGLQRNCTSGVRGVSWDRSNNKWCAKFRLNKICYNVGSFSTLEEAELAVKSARKLHMPFSQEAI